MPRKFAKDGRDLVKCGLIRTAKLLSQNSSACATADFFFPNYINIAGGPTHGSGTDNDNF